MHFFKMHDTSSHKDKRLELPKEFIDKYRTELSDLAIIKVLNSIWHMKLKKAEGVMFFENGWPEFMEFYTIYVGHVLLFRYDGDSKFQVHIFAMDGTEIDYPSHIDNTNYDTEMTSAHSDEDEVEVVSTHSGSTQSNYEPSMSSEPSLSSGSTQSNYEPSISSESSYDQKAEPARHVLPKKPGKQKRVFPKIYHTKEFKATLEAAEAFHTENPFFKVIMQASYIKGCVRVPIGFANSYLRNRKNMGITLRISDGRTWEVRYISQAPTERRQLRGWCIFVADNHLKEGDVCVFELVDRKKFEMIVHLFRQEPARQEFSRKTPKQRTFVHTRIHSKAFQKTLKAAEAFKPDNPSFKRILQASHIKRILKVPHAFVSSYLKNITRAVISLKISDGRTWEVGYISEIETESKLSKGWYKFVADNHLKEGDVCVFELVDTKKFQMNVHFFRQQNTLVRKLNPDTRYYTTEFQATLEAAEDFTSENPFFKVVMQASYIEGQLLRVPADFATSHLRNITETTITLMVSDGRTWKVRYVSRSPTDKRLSHDWCKFVADNDLKEGNVCVFELIDRQKIEMIVHIFRQHKPFSSKLPPKSSNYTAEFQATLAEAEKFTSENPFFKVVIQDAHIKAGTVRVPAIFATQHLTDITRMVISLRISDEKTWEVGYVSQTPIESRLSQGWREFVADNDLKEGDVCVFELVDNRENFEMNVHIFRLVQDVID